MINYAYVSLSLSSLAELAEAIRALPPALKELHVSIESSPESKTDTPDETVPETETPAEPVLDITDVRAALADARVNIGVDGMRAILQKYGASKLADLDPKHYAAVMEEAKNAC